MVVDMCAGAGGKTLALGARMANKGRILALDVHDKRLEQLRKRARRAGLHTVEARVLGIDPPQVRAPGAMRVLVDAPCTGLGSLRRNPEARWRLVPEDLLRLQAQQLEIAERALTMVAPGGRLIYATCSFARAECEDVVSALMQKHPHLQRVTVREVLGRRRTDGLTDDTGTVLRTWPDVAEMDGFFAAVLRVPAAMA
jgi:16S rRNA (cytosine967-C5)-methyltransferase